MSDHDEPNEDGADPRGFTMGPWFPRQHSDEGLLLDVKLEPEVRELDDGTQFIWFRLKDDES